ncbi:MAG: thioredoxin family protein [Saprospiraceae bacterium]
MAYTVSNMLPLGTLAPDFTLPDTVSGKTLSLSDIKSDKATLIIFSCNHCPYVHFVNDEIVNIANDYQPKGVSIAIISVNDIERYPQDAPEEMTKFAAESGYTFPYLYDASQEIGKAYDAACTPDFYVFDGDLKLAYRGQMDDARPSLSMPVTGKDLRAALDAVLTGNPVNEKQRPSGGCGIKWNN